MVKTRNVQMRQTERRLRHGIAVQLMMECIEEELSPVQIKCQKDQALHYHKAMEKIRDAHQLARSGKAYVTTSDDARKAVPQAQNVPKQTPPKGALVSQINSTQKQASGPERSTSPDVIFVSESPPKAKPKPALPQPQSPARAPPQPPRPTIQQPIPNQPSTASPTVYQFVSLNSNSPRTQILMRPVKTPPLQSFPGHRGPVPARILPKVPNIRMPAKLIQVPQIASVTTPVAGTFGMGVKRSVEDPNKMALAKKKRIETDESGNWVPLDEYYYGKMEGDPGYTEEKGEYRFKCWSCSKMLYNNTKAMMHIQGHIDSSKQQNIDLSDLTQCKHCYKQFDTPFEMQTHVEKVHMNNVNVLMCRICERDHESRQSLTNHMRQNHNSCEMPYICQLCKFRSSMYSDVVDHFKKKHDSSQHLLCLYCLKVFNVKFVSQGWGQTQTYYGHLLKHQSKTSSKKCQLCRLTFFNPQDVKQHRKRDHTPNHKGIGSNARYTTPGQLMIKVPESGIQGKQNVKSLNAPAVSKVLDFGGTRFPSAVHVLHCIECKMVMGTPDHYKKYVECSMCRFATSCSIAYANHMMGFHSGQMSSLNLNIPWERPMETTMYCLCGFGSRYGNKIANHLVYCTKQSCYKTRPTTLADDGDEEEKDPRHKPGASLLDVLGLVKKRTVTTKDTLHDDEVRRSSEESQELVWKSSGDAESRVHEEEESSGNKEDEIPPEYKGPRKWSTVKITDQKTPTKASVFLGAEVTEKILIKKSELSKVTEKGDNSESKIKEQKKESGKGQEVDSSGKGGTDHKLQEADSSDKGGNLGIKKESETKGEQKSDTVSASKILETKVKKEPTEDIKEEKIVEKSVGEKEISANSSSTLIGKDETKEESNSNTTEAQESSKSGGVPDVHVKHSQEDDSKHKGDPDCNTNDESESHVSTSAIKVEESVKEDQGQGQTEEVPMETDSSICEVSKKEENRDSKVEAMETEESSKEVSTETNEQSQSENRVNENPVGDLESQSGQISQDNTKSEIENVTEYTKSEESEADVTCSERTKEGSGDSECVVKESVTMETESVTDKGDDCEKVQENAISTKSEKSAISGKSDVELSGNLDKVEDSVDQKSAVSSETLAKGDNSVHQKSAESSETSAKGDNSVHQKSAESSETSAKGDNSVHQKSAESSETSAKGDNSVHQKSAESSETSAKGDNSVHQKSAESSETSAKGDNSVHQKSAESSETSAKGDNSVHQKSAESSETSAKGDNSVHQKSAESSETSAKGDNSVHQKPSESSASMTKGDNSVGQKSDHSESKSRNVDDHRKESRAPSEREQRDHGKPSERERSRESSGDRHHGYHGNKQDHHRDRDRHHSDKYHGQHRYNDDRRSHDHHHHGDHRSGDYNRDRHGRFHYDDRNNYTRDYHDNRDNRGNRQQGGYHGNHRGPYRGNWGGQGGRGYGYGGYQGNYR